MRAPAHEIINRVKDACQSGKPSREILASTVEILQQSLPGWNWVGIYLLAGDTLLLGPYVGKPTDHTRIKVGVGVCGTAVKEDANIIVDDVTSRENYLACTLETRSEIV